MIASVDLSRVYDGNTRQFAESYRRGVREALPTNLSPTDAFWTALADMVASYSAMTERRERRPPKRELERWKRIGALVDKLGGDLREVRRGTRWGAPDPMLANRALEALTPLKLAAEAHVAGYAMLNAAGRGHNPLRRFLFGAVLDLWAGLGLETRYSRSREGTPTGPLLRFFNACVGPILGDEAPSTFGVALIVDREKRRRHTRSKVQK